MELYAYLKFLLSHWLWLLIGSLVGGLIAASIAYTTADKYRASISILVQRAADPSSENYFTYEGYYAQQTAAAYTDTALELLTNEEIVRRAADQAGLSTDVSSISRIKNAIVTKKDAPQLIKVDVTMGERNDALHLAEGLSQALRTRTAEISAAGGDSRLSVAQINEAPAVVLVRPLWWLYAIVGLVLGLIAATIAAALWTYSRSHRT